MSATRTFRGMNHAPDHFEPEDSSDPMAQRRMRGQLEQIDYTAFAANREVIGAALGETGADSFRRLALAVAAARARWVAEALAISETPTPAADRIARLAQLRDAYQELGEAYEGLRRIVERGYVPYRPAATR